MTSRLRTALSRLRTALAESHLLRHLLIAALTMVVVVLVLSTVSDFRRFQLAEMAALAVAAGGLTMLIGVSGQLSLGHGALMAIGAYTTAMLLPDREASTPLVLVILVSIVITTLAGAVVGIAAARLHGPYLAGATLALAVAVPGLALHFSDAFGGEQGMRIVAPDVPTWAADATWFLTATDLTRAGWLAFVCWTVLVVTFLLLANLATNRVGRRWRAVRDDEVAAQLAGIDVGRARIEAFMVSAAAAGAAGSLLGLVVRLAAPGSFTIILSITLVAAVVLGGLGSLTGAVIGAGLLTFLPQVTTQVGRDLGLDDIQAAELAPLVLGIVMVLVVLLAPGGLVGAVRGPLMRRRARRALASRPPTPAAAATPVPPQKTPATSTDHDTPSSKEGAHP